MIRNPNFQVRKRKWKTVSFLFKKSKRKLDNNNNNNHFQHSNFAEILAPNDEVLARIMGDNDRDDVAEEDENPRNGDDERIRESCENQSSTLGLDDDADDYVDAEMDRNPRNEDDENENCKLGGLGLGGDDEEDELKDSKSGGGGVMVVSEKDVPPDDDCCPICFDNFTIACKTNCGHWFCAKCILQFWTYRTALQKCNCPICARPISKLTPEASLLIMQEVEVVEVLKNVQRYNRLFQGGINGVIRKAFEVPNVFKRLLCGLMDPDRFRGNYYAMRSFALMMSCIYNVSSFDFIPTGTLGVRRLFDLCAIALVVILCLVGICHRLMLRRRVRHLAGNQF